jgi:hypothetical protein
MVTSCSSKQPNPSAHYLFICHVITAGFTGIAIFSETQEKHYKNLTILLLFLLPYIGLCHQANHVMSLPLR